MGRALPKHDLVIGLTRTSVGPVVVAVQNGRPVRVYLGQAPVAQARKELGRVRRDDMDAARVLRMVHDALAGKPVKDPLDHLDATAFERAVWRAACDIPRGKVMTYGTIARRIDRPRAARAVGNALHRNPLPLLVPCHRVVRADGSLGGFGAGPAVKTALLAREGVPLCGGRVSPTGAAQFP